MARPRADLARLAPDGRAARQLMRAGAYNGHTAGMAPGHVQANLVILPRREADDFLRFCQRNPKPDGGVHAAHEGKRCHPRRTGHLALSTGARRAFRITHAPGCMLVTDLLNHRIASF